MAGREKGQWRDERGKLLEREEMEGRGERDQKEDRWDWRGL